MKDAQRELILKGLESLQERAHVPAEYLTLRVGLFRAQSELFDSAALKSQSPVLPLGPGSLALSPELLAGMLIQTADSLPEKAQARADLLKLAENQETLPELVESSAFGPNSEWLKNFSLQTGISGQVLLFFGRALAAPYLRKIALSIGENEIEALARTQSCPYCGSEPGLSVLRGESGKRLLVCPLCGMEWEFPRLACPFCAKDNSLELIREEENAACWIEACSSCRRYLKALDQRKLMAGELIPLKEAVATLYLDFIAEEQDLEPGLPYVALR